MTSNGSGSQPPGGGTRFDSVVHDSVVRDSAVHDRAEGAAADRGGKRGRRGPTWWKVLRRVVEAAMVLGGVYAFWMERGQVAQAASLFRHLRWEWVGAACLAEVASMVVFARLQRWLLRAGGVPTRLWTMVKITLAGNSLAVSLPGGAAWSAGFAFEQLRRRGASRALSIWVLLVAGALSSFALFVLLVLGIELAGNHGPARSLRTTGAVLAAIPVLVALGGVAWAWWPGGRKALRSTGAWVCRRPRLQRACRLATSGWDKVTLVRPSAGQWSGAFALAAANWVYDAACLVAAVLALGGSIPWPGVLVAYGVAQIGASLPVSPGGLGVVEGSLTYALILYGMPIKVAVASVLLYRVISFWALVPIGWGAWGLLVFANRKGDGRRERHPWAWHVSHAGRP